MDPAHLLTEYRAAGSTSELARRLGQPYSTIRGWLTRAGIQTNRTGYRSPKAVSHRGPDHHKWRGGTYVTADGYVMEYAPDHPAAPSNKGYVMQHRLVVERAIGRVLGSKELVHHRNQLTQDNRLENLEIIGRAAHVRHHKTGAARTSGGRFVG